MKQHIDTSNFAIYKPRKDRCDTCTAYNARNVLCIMFGMSQRVTSHPTRFSVCCCLPTPMTLASGGVRCSRFWSTSQRIYPSGHQLHHSSGVCPQIQMRQCGAYVGAVEEIVCVMCVGVAEGHSGAVCYLVSTLCKYDLRKGYLYVLSWGRVRRVRREVCVRV